MEINIERSPQHWCPSEGSNSELLLNLLLYLFHIYKQNLSFAGKINFVAFAL